MKKMFALFLATLMMVTMFTGCSSGDSKETSAAQKPSEAAEITEAVTESTVSENVSRPKTGGTLNVAIPGGMTATNIGYIPTATNSLVSAVAGPCIEAFYLMDRNGNAYPRLAESWDVSEDGLHYVFHLRKGVKFHDGSDFNAEVAKWNLDQISAEGQVSGNASVESVDIVDDYTIQVNLTKSSPVFMINFCSMMISKKSFDEHGADWCIVNPVGTGPYKFKLWELDSKIVYERNENYWGTPGYVDEVEFDIITDSTVLATAYQNGDVDLLMGSGSSDLALMLAGQSGSVKYVSETAVGNEFLYFGVGEQSPFKDVRVRQAVYYALDIGTIVDSVLGESYSYSGQWASAGSVFYDASIPTYEYNPEKAKELLAEAGYAEGFEITLRCETDQKWTATAEAIAMYLQDVGIRCNIDAMESARYFSDIIVAGWQDGLVLIANNYGSGLPLQTIANMYTREMQPLRVASMYLPEAWYENIDKAMGKQLVTDTVADVQAAMKAWNEEAVSPCFQTVTIWYAKDYVQGVNINYNGWNCAEIWLNN